MTIKRPNPNLERGGYTAIVYKDGDLFVAEDNVGNLIIKNSDASTTIQKAIDDYASKGQVTIIPDIALSQPLKFTKEYQNVNFIGNITSEGVNAFELGDATHSLAGGRISFGKIDGINKVGHGIVFKNVAFAQIDFVAIKNCNIGLYFDASPGGDGARECTVIGGAILALATAGIKFSASTTNMEGNYFVGLIGYAPVGFETSSVGNCSYQTYCGVIDCVDTAGSEDIKDYRGHQLFMLDYTRRETCIINKNSLLINVRNANKDHALLEGQEASIDFKNVGFTPLLIWDFNRDSSADWNVSGCSMSTPSKSVVRITASNSDPYIYRAINVDGGQAQTIIIRYKYVSGTKSDALGIMYKTSGHGFSSSYVQTTHYMIEDGEWHTVVLNMVDLVVGRTDWIDNVITEIRIDYTEVQAVYDIDYIAIGGRGYGSMYNMDDMLKTPAGASAQGNKGDIRWDANYIYICTATDTWKRMAITTW